jgi:hypothetical protein
VTPICESWLLREPNREHQNVPMNVLLWVGTALGGAARDTGRARARRAGPAMIATSWGRAADRAWFCDP